MTAEELVEGMPWIEAVASVFRTREGTCRVAERWTNIDMFVVSKRIAGGGRSMEAWYDYPSVPHRPVVLGMNRRPCDAMAVQMCGPQPLPWQRPIGPDLPVPPDSQLQLRSIGDGQADIDRAYATVITALEDQAVARNSMGKKEAAKHTGRAEPMKYHQHPLDALGRQNIPRRGLLHLKKVAAGLKDLLFAVVAVTSGQGTWQRAREVVGCVRKLTVEATVHGPYKEGSPLLANLGARWMAKCGLVATWVRECSAARLMSKLLWT